MTLRFILGKVSTKKSQFIIDEIKTELTNKPIGPSIFYITPEQMTFEQEKSLFKDDELNGSIRSQVYSFSRLAWHVIQETSGAAKQHISSTGMQMMLRKIIEHRDEPFLVFQKAIEKQGFIEELEGVMTEFKRHCITPQSLKEQIDHIEQIQNKNQLSNKLTDLYDVFNEFSLALEDKYIDGEDQLQMLADQLKNAPSIQNAHIYIDGFYRFTPKELSIIEALLDVASQVTIALSLDYDKLDQLDELDLFHQTTETYQVLKAIAKEKNIQEKNHVYLTEESSYLKENKALLHLEKHFDTRPTPQLTSKANLPIEVAEAVHSRAEVEGAAQKILTLVREKDYRYNDFVIFMRDANTYNSLIETVFLDYEIPLFIDEKKPMLNHPLIEMIYSLFELVESNWRYEDMFRLLKTGFIPATDEKYPLTDDAIDRLENYCLEYGIRYKNQWLQKDDWLVQRFKGFSKGSQTTRELKEQEKINSYRNQVVQALKQFDKTIREAKTVKEKCQILFTYLEAIDVVSNLENMRFLYDEAGELEKAREQEQVWSSLIQLIDEYVEISGDEKISQSMFKSVLEAGLESLEFSHVPPNLDHIIVASIDHSRITNKKCAFLLGVNEGVWPKIPPTDGMINEQERETLKIYGLELASSSKRQLLDDWFYMHNAFSSVTDYLWISYPISDSEGRAKLASQLITRLYDLFPSLAKPILLQEPEEIKDATRFITTQRKTRAPLTAQLARKLRGYPVDEIWLSVLNWYIKHENQNQSTKLVLESLFYENKPTKLSQPTTTAFYPQKIETSVSRLETYYRCSYQHYLQYNLKLEERRTYTLDAPDMGQLFHEALKVIAEWVKQENKHFADVSKDDAKKYARKSINHLSPVLQHRILSSSNRYKYIQQKLEDIIAKATYILSEQARLSGFTILGIELGFGFDNEDLAPLIVELPNGYELALRGRIDRVDQAIHNESLYLRIIDYKSSSRGLSLVDVYYGLALQMLTYLDVVLTQSPTWLNKQAKEAGILYFHVHNAMLAEPKSFNQLDIEEDIFKSYKMQGLVVADPTIASLMDTSLESGTSDVVPVGLKKDGDFYSNSKVASEASFKELRTYVRELTKRSGIEMTSGDIKLNPYENKYGNACSFCSFKSVCQFDPSLKSNNYNHLKEYNDDTIIEKIIEANKKGED